MKRLFTCLFAVLCQISLLWPAAAKALENSSHFLKEIYFYPPASNETLLHLFDDDWIVSGATSQFPVIKEMSGVAIIIYWSQLCPSAETCNFQLVDRILDFWSKRGKKVILAVAVIGPPIERVDGNQKTFASATPAWVMSKVKTYKSSSNNFVGNYRDWRGLSNNVNNQFDFPRYDDTVFVDQVRRLVYALGKRYDGNSTISYMRIGTGKAAEDNPYGRSNGLGPRNGMLGFSNDLWLDYSEKVTSFYLEAFHKTQLEFDFGWTAIIAAGINTTPLVTAEAQEKARHFLSKLVQNHVFLAYDGIAPRPTETIAGATAANPTGATCPGYNPQPDDTTLPIYAAPYAEVDLLRRSGVSFGLEGGALSDPCEAPTRIEAILDYYRPVRFVFFGDAAAALSLREGTNDKNLFEKDVITNSIISWTNAANFPAHQAEAAPKIDAFISSLHHIVAQIGEAP